MFNNPFPGAFGLDISDLSIKLVQLENVSNHLSKKYAYKLKTAREISLPTGLVVNGDIEQEEKIKNYILKLLQGTKKGEKKIKNLWVVASLPELQSFIKLITLNKSREEVIDEDIIIEAKKHIPFAEEEKYYLDWEILPSIKENTTRILISAIMQKTADSYTKLLESAGLGVLALENEALSVARTMVTAGKEYKNEARGLLDIGATRSSFIVYDNETVQFSADFSFSGELLTTALAQKLKISREEAETIKIKYGLQYKKQKQVWDLLMNYSRDFATEIRKAIYFYYSHFADTNRIKHITMCGAGSKLKHLDKILSLELKNECRVGKVWKNLNDPKIDKKVSGDSLNYATAIGLALRAADNPFFVKDSI
ncbi:MAG: type IV pilus assembly protein PilM [Patescibacteria group bacterium]